MDRQQMSDHDLLIRIDERTENTEERLGNHADRLRSLEQNHSKIAGMVLMIGAGVTLAANAVLWVLGKVWR